MPRWTMSEEERFWAKVDRAGECWEWRANKTRDGYGLFKVAGRSVLAHRWAFEHERDAIPEGMQLDHLCRNRACVNPAHLEVVTQRENCLRGVSPAAAHAQQTHCVNGHELSGDNLRLEPDGKRVCLTCRRENARRQVASGYFRAVARAQRASLTAGQPSGY